MSPQVQVKIRTQDRLHWTIQNRQELIDACRDPPRLSTRPRQRAGKISFKTQCWMQMAQICGKSSKVWMVLLMPTLQTKQRSQTDESLPTSNPNPTFLYTTMPGSANLTCLEPIETLTNNSRNVSTHNLLMMKAVPHFKWVSYQGRKQNFEFGWRHECIKPVEHYKHQKLLQTDRFFAFCFVFSLNKYALF